jgi:ABC-type transporter Mla MlaB component
LLNILKDQTLNGGKEGTSYTKKAWREIQEQFNDSKVDKLELQQIKNVTSTTGVVMLPWIDF